MYTVIYGKDQKRIKELSENIEGPIIELSLQEIHKWYALLMGAVISQVIGIDRQTLQKYGISFVNGVR